jgi:hypothetical protein
MTTLATISRNEVAVRHLLRPEYNQEHLTIDVPNGWDDVKRICKKVLVFEGRKFTFTGWNSDRNVCFFVRPLNGDVKTASFA